MPNEPEGPGEVRPSATTSAALGDAGLRRVVDSTVDHAIVATDAERRITLWSEGAGRLFGWEEAEVLGRLCDLMFTPEDRAAAVPAREVEAAFEAFAGVPYDRIFGPLNGAYATGHNPTRLAANLRSTRLFVAVGDGTADPSAGSSPAAISAL